MWFQCQLLPLYLFHLQSMKQSDPAGQKGMLFWGTEECGWIVTNHNFWSTLVQMVLTALHLSVHLIFTAVIWALPIATSIIQVRKLSLKQIYVSCPGSQQQVVNLKFEFTSSDSRLNSIQPLQSVLCFPCKQLL